MSSYIRVVHNGRHITIPSQADDTVQLGLISSNNIQPIMRLLICHMDRELYLRTATAADHYHLVCQMLYYEYPDWSILAHLHDCVLPWIGHKIHAKAMMFCLRRNITFLGGDNRHLTYDTIAELDLFRCIVSDAEIAKFRGLHTLNLRRRHNTMAALAGSVNSIATLNISETSIEDVSHLTRLRALDASFNKRLTTFTEPQQPSTFMSTLTMMWDLYTGTGDDELSSVTTNPNRLTKFLASPANTLTHLIVRGSKVRDDDLRIMRNLRILDVSGTRHVTLKFLGQIHPIYPFNHPSIRMDEQTNIHPLCDTLEELIISDSIVDDSGIRYLRRIVKLHAAKCPNVHLAFLSSEHPLHQTLCNLDITSSPVEDTALAQLKSLQKLRISQSKQITLNFLTSRSFFDHPSSLTHSPSFEHSSTIPSFEHPSSLTHSSTIPSFTHPSTIPSFEHSSTIPSFTHPSTISPFTHPLAMSLTELHCDGSGVTDAALSQLRVLRAINADGTPAITLRFLTGEHPLSHSLQEIGATGSCGISDASLQTLTDLRVLNAYCNPRISLSSPCPCHLTMEEINLGGTSGATDASLRLFTCLQKINLKSNRRVTLQDLGPMANTLIGLDVSGTLIDAVALQQFTRLRRLRLHGTSFTLANLVGFPLVDTLQTLDGSGSIGMCLGHMQRLRHVEVADQSALIDLPFLSSSNYHSAPIYHTLEHLDTRGTQIDDYVISKFLSLRYLVLNEKLNLSWLNPSHPLWYTMKIDNDCHSIRLSQRIRDIWNA